MHDLWVCPRPSVSSNQACQQTRFKPLSLWGKDWVTSDVMIAANPSLHSPQEHELSFGETIPPKSVQCLLACKLC